MAIELYSTPLEGNDLRSRREIEREAALKLVREVFGPAAAIDHDSEGRPVLSGLMDWKGMISVSHSERLCVLAVTREAGKSIGVDTETWREQLIRVAPRFLSGDEMGAYTSHSQLLLAWTAKEAVYKAALLPGLALQEIHLPVPAPEGEGFAVTARGRRFTVESVALLSDMAITTAAITMI